MAWITPTIAAVGALGSLGASLAGQGRNNLQSQQAYDLQLLQLIQAQRNQQIQEAQQQLVNQRAVAGTRDSFGTTVQYDPTTNSWVQQLGALPQQADTAAIRANLIRNTTDLMQQELANRVAMERAAQAGPAAEAAQRELANFRPMSADRLTGLLTAQGINAAREAYDPLRADVLRSVARTGSAAGPVLRQLGLGEAQNLRNTLIDAQMRGLTGAADINNANYNRIANRAATTQALATPQLSQGNLGASATDQLLQQLTANRAQWAPSSTAQGSYGANMATDLSGRATTGAAGAVPNTNFGLDQTVSGLKNLASFASDKGPGGLGQLLSSVSGLFSGGGTSDVNYTPAYGSASQNYTATNPAYSDWVPDSSQYNW